MSTAIADARTRLFADSMSGHPPPDLAHRLGSFGYDTTTIESRRQLVNAAAHAAVLARLERNFVTLGLDPGSLAGSEARLADAENALRELDERAEAQMFVSAVRAYHAEQARVARLSSEIGDLDDRVRASSRAMDAPHFKRPFEILAQFGTVARYLETLHGPYHNSNELDAFGLSPEDHAAIVAHAAVLRERDRIVNEATSAALTITQLIERHPDIARVPADTVALLIGSPL